MVSDKLSDLPATRRSIQASTSIRNFWPNFLSSGFTPWKPWNFKPLNTSLSPPLIAASSCTVADENHFLLALNGWKELRKALKQRHGESVTIHLNHIQSLITTLQGKIDCQYSVEYFACEVSQLLKPQMNSRVTKNSNSPPGLNIFSPNSTLICLNPTRTQ